MMNLCFGVLRPITLEPSLGIIKESACPTGDHWYVDAWCSLDGANPYKSYRCSFIVEVDAFELYLSRLGSDPGITRIQLGYNVGLMLVQLGYSAGPTRR